MSDDERDGQQGEQRDEEGQKAEETTIPPGMRLVTPARYAWEQALIDDYSEHRWHRALDPLALLFARWSAGEVDHLEVGRAIDSAHQQIEEDFLFFSDRRLTLVRLIQLDRAWYEPWLAEHPEPEI